MDLVFLQYPPIWLCWVLSLLSALWVAVTEKHSGVFTVLSALLGAVAFFLALFFGIPPEELLLMLAVNLLIVCRGAWGGGEK